jgi:hypothetical protein
MALPTTKYARLALLLAAVVPSINIVTESMRPQLSDTDEVVRRRPAWRLKGSKPG